MEYGGAERREHPRLEGNFVVSYRVLEVTEQYDLTQTKNVSEGGILLTTNRKFAEGTQLAMTLRFPFSNERIELVGVVVGSTEIARDLLYETRIQFQQADTEFFQKLGGFVRDHLQKKGNKNG